MELNRIQKLAGLPLTEAKTKEVKLDAVEKTSYDSSIDFEDAFSNASVAAKHVTEVMKSAAMKEWMKHTDSNFSGFDMKKYDVVISTAKQLEKELSTLYDALSDLS